MQIQELNALWNEVVATRVVQVESISEIVFHSVLGCWLLPTRIYMPGNSALTTRINLFVVSGSRSGKGEVMKLGATICQKDLGLKAEYFSGSLTPKALIGGINKIRDKNGAVVKETETYGQLHSTDFLSWGEARSVLNSKDDFGSMKDVLLSALDDPGIVTARSYGDTYETTPGKVGRIFGYETKSTILTGTIHIKSISTELASSGLLQRFFISVNEKTKDDIKKFWQDIYSQKTQQQEKIDSMIQEKEGTVTASDFTDVLLHERRELRNELQKIKRENFIHFKAQTFKDFGDLHIEEMHKLCINAPHIGPKLDAYNAFMVSSINQTVKVASLKCAVEARSCVSYEDMIYGWELTKKSISSALALLDKGRIASHTDDEGKRVELLLSILEKKKGLTQKQIFEHLKTEFYKNKWDLGVNKTQELLQYLSDKNVIKTIQGTRKTKHYYLSTDIREEK